jgi:hypothetical protein
MEKRRDSTAFPKAMNFLANVISTFKDHLRAIHEGLFFYKSLLRCAQRSGPHGWQVKPFCLKKLYAVK